MNHLDPIIKKEPWTSEEDQILILGQKDLGNCWTVIARDLPGRSDNAVKNRWFSVALQKQVSPPLASTAYCHGVGAIAAAAAVKAIAKTANVEERDVVVPTTLINNGNKSEKWQQHSEPSRQKQQRTEDQQFKPVLQKGPQSPLKPIESRHCVSIVETESPKQKDAAVYRYRSSDKSVPLRVLIKQQQQQHCLSVHEKHNSEEERIATTGNSMSMSDVQQNNESNNLAAHYSSGSMMSIELEIKDAISSAKLQSSSNCEGGLGVGEDGDEMALLCQANNYLSTYFAASQQKRNIFQLQDAALCGVGVPPIFSSYRSAARSCAESALRPIMSCAHAPAAPTAEVAVPAVGSEFTSGTSNINWTQFHDDDGEMSDSTVDSWVGLF